MKPVSLAILAGLFCQTLIALPLQAQEPEQSLPTAEPELHDQQSITSDCSRIEASSARLACYDALHAPESDQVPADATNIRAGEPAALPDGTDTRDPDDDSGVMNSMINRYVETEQAIFAFSRSFVTHRPTYILPFTWNQHPNQVPVSPRTDVSNYDYSLNNKEAKYQISFKVPLLTGVFDDRTTLWFGYTQLSFWQVYNRDSSAPFRETNYEPELFVRYRTDYKFGPGILNGVTFGFNHQSNGQSEPHSRSWNRIIASAGYSYDRWLFLVQPWYRLPEDRDSDDNHDLERYVGHADYYAIYKLSEDKTLSLKLRNNLRSDDNKTSVELGYSFPMGGSLKGFIQYFNGYGESLIDYNSRISRIGFGIMLNDWL